MGRTEDARQFAIDMMLLDDQYTGGDPEKANGDVVYNGHVVLGQIALDASRIEEAKRHLLARARAAVRPHWGVWAEHEFGQGPFGEGRAGGGAGSIWNCAASFGVPVVGSWTSGSKTSRQAEFELGLT